MTEPSLEKSATQLREALGEGFSLDFISRVEERLGVDVIIVPLQGPGYSMTMGGRRVVVIAASEHWFRSAFTLAHELGHFFDPRADLRGAVGRDSAEKAANAYAAELLMPRKQIRSQRWATAEDVAQAVWSLGVSTKALKARLASLHKEVPEAVGAALDMTTPRLLSDHLPQSVATPDQVTLRAAEWARRRFPTHLLTSLRLAVEQGKAPQASLEWALGVPTLSGATDQDRQEGHTDSDGLDLLDLELLGVLE